MTDIASHPSRSPRRAPANESSARSSLTPGDWVAAATEVLVSNGIDAVRVDVIAKLMKVTRGSFYWHFKDRDDLLRSLLEAWRKTTTEQIIERFEQHEGTPEELFRDLLSLPFRGRAAARAASIELAIRAWARRDQTARNAVDEVDARRISYISQCFSALGFPLAQARQRAFLLYAYEVAESILFNQGNPSEKRKRSALAEHLLLMKTDSV